MPINTDSKAWESGSLEDRLSTTIAHRLLLDNPDKAYSVKEITDWILEEYPELIPRSLRESGNDEGSITLVASVLDRLDRRQFVTCRIVEKENDQAELYYKNAEGDAHYPNVRLNHEIPDRFEEVEEEIGELEEQLSNLEYEMRVEAGDTW